MLDALAGYQRRRASSIADQRHPPARPTIHADLDDIIEVELERIAHFIEQLRELPSRFLREHLPDDVLLNKPGMTIAPSAAL